ncbi:MAG TPA: hypothetical protein VFX12_08820 [Vicinamibacterales bacterium]|nr:hypothetical protein [Vicinamibacterales bacterium]
MAKQLSNKAGLKSLGKKEDNSRGLFRSQPAAHPVGGATGEQPRKSSKRPSHATATSHAGKAAALRGIARRHR